MNESKQVLEVNKNLNKLVRIGYLSKKEITMPKIRKIVAAVQKGIKGGWIKEKDILRVTLFWYLQEIRKAYVFDAECIYDWQNDYTKLIQALVVLSAGVLKRVKVIVHPPGKSNEGPLVKIILNNKTYKRRMMYSADFADTDGLLSLLNEIIEDLNGKRRFRLLDVTKDQCANVFFLIPKEYKMLKSLLE